MKIKSLVHLPVFLMAASALLYSCRATGYPPTGIDGFPSQTYEHFKGGALFSDVAHGLDLLWKASFKNGNTYKENLAFFVPEGLLILPNKNNTRMSASLNMLRTKVRNGALYVDFKDVEMKVLGIIHTHPDMNSVRMPAPRFDYQFCYLGVHNYIIAHRDIFDAFKDDSGNEKYIRLGSRSDYDKIPWRAFLDPMRSGEGMLYTFQE